MKKFITVIVFCVLLAVFFLVGKMLHSRLTAHPVYVPTEKIEEERIDSKIIPSSGEQIEVKTPGSKALLPGATWVPQTFNNCGPATVSMILQYFGHTVGQDVTQKALRTNADDKNVFTYEIQRYLRGYGIESRLFFNGDRERIKTLLANGFYVMVEDWLRPGEDIGHVTILRGYDDDQGVFIADDSYLGVNIVYAYDVFEEEQWKPFNREYLPIYRPEKEVLLKAIVGVDWESMPMYEKAIEAAKHETSINTSDMYAWFNLGTSYYALGDNAQAKTAFEKSRALGWPKRMLWYQIQPVQVYNELGEYDKALELSRIGLSGNDSFAELHVESARAYIGLGETDRAKFEIQKAIEYSPGLESAKAFQATL